MIPLGWVSQRIQGLARTAVARVAKIHAEELLNNTSTLHKAPPSFSIIER